MCIDWEVFWNALSSIGTIAAVIVALYITKWQNVISNRKEIKIKYRNGYVHGNTIRTFDGFPEEKPINCITVEFINTGNRKVILDSIKLEFKSKHAFGLIPPFSSLDDKEMTLPCGLEIEEVGHFRILVSDFHAIVKNCLESSQGSLNDEIVIVASDTTGKEYRYKTGFKYNQYLDIKYIS